MLVEITFMEFKQRLTEDYPFSRRIRLKKTEKVIEEFVGGGLPSPLETHEKPR